MENNNKRSMIGITVLLLSLMQMATTGLSPMMAGVSEAFPAASAETVQFLMTMPGIFVVFFSLFSAWLVQKFPKKWMICIGSVCMALAGILAVAFHGSIALLRVWSGLLGIGMGLVAALTISLLTDYYEDGPEKARLMGLQSGANNLGAMIMSLIGGVLASVAWYLNYFVLLLILPGFICCLLFVPAKNVEKKEKTQGEKQTIRINSTMIKYALVGMLFLFAFNAVPANLSMFIAENGIGDAAAAGVASAVSLAGGVLVGMLFGKIDSYLRLYTLPAGFLCLCLGVSGIAFSHAFLPLLVSCFLSGSAITFIMPQCMMQVTKGTNATQAAFATAMVMSGSNMGTFLTPVLSTIAKCITGSTATVYRYYVCIVITFVSAIVLTVLIAATGRKKKNRPTV